MRLLLRVNFGGICERVGERLFRLGRATALQLSSASTPVRQVREALFVLIHHLVVKCEGAEEGAKSPAVYSMQPRALTVRLHYPEILHLVQSRYGDAKALVVRKIFLHTRIQRAHFDSSPEQSAAVEDLVRDGFLRLVDPSDANANAFPPTKLPPSVHSVPPAPDCAVATGRPKRKLQAEPVPEPKRIAPAAPAAPAGPAAALYVCASFRRSLLAIQGEFLRRYVLQKYNQGAAAIAKEILFAMETQSQISPHQLQAALNERHGGGLAATLRLLDGASGLSPLEQYLSVLVADSCNCFWRSSAGGYFVDQEHLDRFIRVEQLRSLTKAALGDVAHRVFNLLLSNATALDDRLICKQALVPMQQAREILIKMARYGLVLSQEVPRTADHAPNRTSYLWRASPDNAVAALKNHLLQAIGNLLVRLEAERRDHQDLIAKSERTDVRSAPELLSEGERKALRRLEQSTSVIASSIVALSGSLGCINL